MFVTFTPAEGDPQHWEYIHEDVFASRAEMIEKRFGASWEQFGAAVIQGSMKARRVLLWHLMGLQHPTLRYEDVPDFRSKELECEFSVAELTRMRESLSKANLAEDTREQVMTALDIQITEMMAKEGITEAGEAPGKARSRSSAKSTG